MGARPATQPSPLRMLASVPGLTSPHILTIRDDTTPPIRLTPAKTRCTASRMDIRDCQCRRSSETFDPVK